jgi:hypothetical protein
MEPDSIAPPQVREVIRSVVAKTTQNYPNMSGAQQAVEVLRTLQTEWQWRINSDHPLYKVNDPYTGSHVRHLCVHACQVEVCMHAGWRCARSHVPGM